MGERRKGKESCKYFHMTGTAGERLRGLRSRLVQRCLTASAQAPDHRLQFRALLDLNILLLPLLLKEEGTCVTSVTEGSSSCRLCIRKVLAFWHSKYCSYSVPPPLIGWRLIVPVPHQIRQVSQGTAKLTKLVCVHFINYKKRDIGVLILLWQSGCFHLKEEEGVLLAQTNPWILRLDALMFISEQSVRRKHPHLAQHNSFAISRGRTAFQEFPRALVELSPKAQEMWRCTTEPNAGTCVRQNV